MTAEELDDVSGDRPDSMTEEQIIDILKGHKFRFHLDNYQQYSLESRKITEQILKFEEFKLESACDTLEEHLKEFQEP